MQVGMTLVLSLTPIGDGRAQSVHMEQKPEGIDTELR
jgi:hypothetical protein